MHEIFTGPGGAHVHESEGEPVLPEDDPSDTVEDDMTHEQQIQEALQNATSIHGI